MSEDSTVLECPSCGASVPIKIRFTKLAVCEHCQITLFLEDEAVVHVGKRSALTSIPSIFKVGGCYRHRNSGFEVIGRIQFDYGGGLWDEWWVMMDNGEGKWLSVDEGDIVMEVPFDPPANVADFNAMSVGQELRIDGMSFLVTEKDSSTCVGIEGQLPELVFPGKVYDYVHLTGSRGVHYTIEYCNGQVQAYKGVWIDPFDIMAV
jgi:hypothetical protein